MIIFIKTSIPSYQSMREFIKKQSSSCTNLKIIFLGIFSGFDSLYMPKDSGYKK